MASRVPIGDLPANIRPGSVGGPGTAAGRLGIRERHFPEQVLHSDTPDLGRDRARRQDGEAPANANPRAVSDALPDYTPSQIAAFGDPTRRQNAREPRVQAVRLSDAQDDALLEDTEMWRVRAMGGQRQRPVEEVRAARDKRLVEFFGGYDPFEKDSGRAPDVDFLLGVKDDPSAPEALRAAYAPIREDARAFLQATPKASAIDACLQPRMLHTRRGAPFVPLNQLWREIAGVTGMSAHKLTRKDDTVTITHHMVNDADPFTVEILFETGVEVPCDRWDDAPTEAEAAATLKQLAAHEAPVALMEHVHVGARVRSYVYLRLTEKSIEGMGGRAISLNMSDMLF